MSIRIDFTTGAFRTIESDAQTIAGEIIVFSLQGEAILTAVLENTISWGSAELEPLRQEPRLDLFSARAR